MLYRFLCNGLVDYAHIIYSGAKHINRFLPHGIAVKSRVINRTPNANQM